MDTEKQLLSKAYDPKQIEDKWYARWEASGIFAPNMDSDAEPFTIAMPPPNVTGRLHMGHAMDNTMQDILVRYKRLKGFKTLWVPGTDHAGIATQARVEENLREEGLTKEDLGREAFIQKCWDWKEEYGNVITSQIRKLGASCDWDRERFTMDEICSRAVREAFVDLYHKDLIYRGQYIVNWCPYCQTTISDIEVEHEEQEGKLYYINYFLEDDSGYLTVATTRPETMFGDTAVAVHPDDSRYKEYIGKNVILPIINRPIPVIADEYVDPEFGTGALKITPSHDVNDFEIGERHQLPHVVVIDQDGVLNKQAGPYEGMERFAARKKIVKDLAESPNLDRIEDYSNAVGQCYRCDTVIEPLVSTQWFVRMEPLAKPALDGVLERDIRFVPERFTKIYTGWMENIRDWCISRQLWWGHRIPVWYCKDCDHLTVTKEDPSVCEACGSEKLRQDEDVLDTWFSSGLWPFEVLGWPDETEDLETFYPTNVLVTGRDIIFFWVARMIVDGYEFTGQRPFEDVLIHGLVLDEKGRKMSKSLGNGIDPLEEIDSYGADALRLTLVTGNTAGNDLRYRRERIEANRNFTNKFWNASRFVQMHTEDFDLAQADVNSDIRMDRWILGRMSQTANDVAAQLDAYNLGDASKLIHDFIWNEFCDWYIELIKPRLYGHHGEDSKLKAQKTAVAVLRQAAIVLHPFMPFITEEIWEHFSLEKEGSIMIQAWPEGQAIDEEAIRALDLVMDLVRGIRNLRRDFNIPVGQKIPFLLHPTSEDAEMLVEEMASLANLGALEEPSLIEKTPEDVSTYASSVVAGNTLYVPLKDVLDLEAEVTRFEKEVQRLQGEIKRAESKLQNEGFILKAPAEVVQAEKDKVLAYQQDLELAQNQKLRLSELL